MPSYNEAEERLNELRKSRESKKKKKAPNPKLVFSEEAFTPTWSPVDEIDEAELDFDLVSFKAPDLLSDRPRDLTLTQKRQLRDLLAEMNRRRREALKLFKPMPSQAAFFACKSPERLVRGGNRGGKTLAAAVEVARAVTGQDPYGKYPKTNGRFALVGWDLQHCADVMFRKLFRPGAFKIIKDPVTGDYRAYDPSIKYDADHEYLAEEAPPLIPRRFVKSISWEDKKRGIPKLVELTTGWEITFYSSKSDPPQGIDIDGAWFDEEIQIPLWYREISARFLDRRRKSADGTTLWPMFIWSATPLAGTEQLLELSNRAEDEVNSPNPTTSEFLLGLLDNTSISEDSKKEFIKKMANEDEYRVRVLGDFAILGTRIYSEFSPRGMHKIESFPIPLDWTRYCAIDPGRQVCAVLFAAVPPPSHPLSGHVIIYKELYIKQCDAKKFAAKMEESIRDEQIQEWWIDHQAGRMTEIGSGRTPEEQYSEELKALRVGSVVNKHSFSWGSPDLGAGILSVRSCLCPIQKDNKPRFLFMTDNLKNLCNEIERYSYKRNSTGQVTDEVVKKNDHLCFVAGTMVQTGRGPVPIELVEPGESVLTRRGLRPVVAAAMTSPSASVVEVRFSDGSVLVGRASHPVFVDELGYMPMGKLEPGQLVVSLAGGGLWKSLLRSSLFTMGLSSGVTRIREGDATGSTTGRQPRSGFQVSGGFIKRFGLRAMALFRRAITFTTLTGTPSTTALRILRACTDLITSRSTAVRFLPSTQKTGKTGFSLLSMRQGHGTQARREGSGTPGTVLQCGRTGFRPGSPASIAERTTKARSLPRAITALVHAAITHVGILALTTRRGFAVFAERALSATSTSRRLTALKTVSCVREVQGSHAVYNIQVDGENEYFANGVLSHNCDCMRYLAQADLKYVRPKKAGVLSYTNEIIKRKRKKAQAASGWGGAIKLG